MFPHERSLVARLKDQPFALIGVNSDKDKIDYVEQAKENGIVWRSFWNGPKGTAGPISAKWNVGSWSTASSIFSRRTFLKRITPFWSIT